MSNTVIWDSPDIRVWPRYQKNTSVKTILLEASILWICADFTKLKNITSDVIPINRSIPEDMNIISITYHGNICTFASTLKAVLTSHSAYTRCRILTKPLNPIPLILLIKITPYESIYISSLFSCISALGHHPIIFRIVSEILIFIPIPSTSRTVHQQV